MEDFNSCDGPHISLVDLYKLSENDLLEVLQGKGTNQGLKVLGVEKLVSLIRPLKFSHFMPWSLLILEEILLLIVALFALLTAEVDWLVMLFSVGALVLALYEYRQALRLYSKYASQYRRYSLCFAEGNVFDGQGHSYSLMAFHNYMTTAF
jgi:hypothetical protein